MFAETSGKERWETQEGTQMERNKRKERILIRNLREKIIGVADSKCQHQEGEQMEGGSCTHRHTNTGREGRERSIQKETGGAAVMETPLLLPPGGRNTIFLVLRGKTLPGRYSQYPTGGRQSCQGQEGES